MFDAKSLLDGLLQSGVGTSQSAGARLQNAVSPSGMGGQGGILDQLGGLLGGQARAGGDPSGGLGGLLAGLAGSGAPGSAGAAQGGLGALLSGLTAGGAGGGGLGGILGQIAGAVQSAAGQTKTAVQSNNPAAVGGLGAVAGALLGGRSGAVGGGLLAVLGSIAYSALQNAGQSPAVAPQAGVPHAPLPEAAAALPPGLAMGPDAEAEAHHAALLCLQAMISAAKADGNVDAQEVQKILGKLKELGADPEAQAFVMTEMQKPLDVDVLVAQVPNPQVAVQVYAASLLAVEVDTPVEEAYLTQLAHKLGLPPQAVAEVNRVLGLATA